MKIHTSTWLVCYLSCWSVLFATVAKAVVFDDDETAGETLLVQDAQSHLRRGLNPKGKDSEKVTYIVVLKPKDDKHTSSERRADAILKEPGLAGRGGQIGYVYETAIQGFSLSVPAPAAEAVFQALSRNPQVSYIDLDGEVRITAQSIPTGIPRSFATTNSKLGINGLDEGRVDVDVAILDTGIDLAHPDLNVVGGVDCTVGGVCGNGGTSGNDDQYHGTHCAGTVAAIDNGRISR